MSAPRVRSTTAWLAVLALAVAAIVWQGLRGGTPPGHDDHDDDAAAALIDLAEANWSAVELLGPSGMHRLERDASARWLLHGAAAPGETADHRHRADPAAAERIASVLGTFARARIERTLPADPARLTAYGLDRPEWVVLIHGADRQPVRTLELGQVAPDRLSRYVRLAQDGRVVTIPNYHIDALLALLPSS